MKKSLLLLSLIVATRILGSQNDPAKTSKPAKAAKRAPAKELVKRADRKSGEETAEYLEEFDGKLPHVKANQPKDCAYLREARRQGEVKAESRRTRKTKAKKADTAENNTNKPTNTQQ